MAKFLRVASLSLLSSLVALLTFGDEVDSKKAASAAPTPWLMSEAFAIPKECCNQGSGYFSIVTGKNQRIYVGAAKYGENSYLVEFDPPSGEMRVAVDTHKEIGVDLKGFAAQSKIHTRNNVGPSGRIYFGTKQGYTQGTETWRDYPGGYPMVYDPQTEKTRVYPIPIPNQGIISVTPDEARGVAYISTCSDGQPAPSSHFMILDLEKGTYRDLLDCDHIFAFIVVDWLGRAYHPIRGGDIARYDPRSDRLDRLRQTIDGAPPTPESLLALDDPHPINWDISPDGKTLYAVAMSGDRLYAYDLTAEGETLPGRSLGRLLPDARATDCRAMCVGPAGEVCVAVTGHYGEFSNVLHLVTYRPGDASPRDRGAVAISNPDYTAFTDQAGAQLPFHHGQRKTEDGVTTTVFVILGVTQAADGSVYILSLCPYTLQRLSPAVLARVPNSR